MMDPQKNVTTFRRWIEDASSNQETEDLLRHILKRASEKATLPEIQAACRALADWRADDLRKQSEAN